VTAILALDPGLTKPGVALHHHDGHLVKADRLKVDAGWAKLGILDRCDHVAELAQDWFREFKYPLGGETALTLIVEWPQWYGDNEKGIDPNDLAGLCGISGSLLGRLRSGWREVRAVSPKPREVWGSVPKKTTGNPWSSPRGSRLAARLTAEERARVGNYHDALDAAGLALYAAGRWKQRRLYPGAV
jgi:hypothetical protein